MNESDSINQNSSIGIKSDFDDSFHTGKQPSLNGSINFGHRRNKSFDSTIAEDLNETKSEINMIFFFAGDFNHKKEVWKMCKVEFKLKEILDVASDTKK